MTEGIPPQNLEAERAVLASALINESAARLVASRLPLEAFYQDSHRLIFAAITALLDDKQPTDIVSVAYRLQRDGTFGDIGGLQALKDIAGSVAIYDYADHYTRIVLLAWHDRELMRLAHIVSQASEAEDMQRRDSALEDIQRVCRARDLAGSKSGVSASEAAHAVMDKIDSDTKRTIRCGIGAVDDFTGGQHAGDLMTVGARTGVGKTSVLLTAAMHMARSGEAVAFCGGEMAPDQIAARALSAISGVPHWRFRGRKPSMEDMRLLHDAGAEFARLPIHFCTAPSPSLREIRAFSDSCRASVVIVDYLTRCELPRAESMRVSVNHFMRGLKNFARETERAVILAAQINRRMDANPDCPPTLADLKESSAIEEESDQVLLLFPGSAGGQNPPLHWVLAKNRHGATARGEIAFARETMRVGDDEEPLPFDRQTAAAGDKPEEEIA